VVSHFGVLLLANLTAVVLSIPLLLLAALTSAWINSLALFPLGVALLVGILPNPAAAGLQVATHDLATGDIVYLKDQWRGLREHSGLAFRTWLVSLAISAIILVNIVFYGRAAVGAGAPLHDIARPAQAVWLLLLFLWVALHVYVYPLIVRQEVRKVQTIYRNAFVIMAARPIFTLGAALSWLVVIFVGAATGMAALVGLAAAAAIQQNALAYILPSFEGGSSAAPYND
jgi:hypothetical protein